MRKKSVGFFIMLIAVFMISGCALNTAPSAGGDYLSPGARKVGGNYTESGGVGGNVGNLVHTGGKVVGGDNIESGGVGGDSVK